MKPRWRPSLSEGSSPRRAYLDGGLADKEQVGELLGGHELVEGAGAGVVGRVGHGRGSAVGAGVEFEAGCSVGEHVGREMEALEALLGFVVDLPAGAVFGV